MADKKEALALVSALVDIATRVSTLEILAAGRKLGLPLAALTEAINNSTARSHLSEVVLPAMLQGRSLAGAGLAAETAQLDQVLALGHAVGVPLRLTALVRGLLQAGVYALAGQQSDTVGLTEWMAATRFVDAPAVADSAPAEAKLEPRARPVVGYVGLGAMGAALALRLLRSYEVHVTDVRPQAVAELQAAGAIAAPDLPALARACDVIMICVPTSAVVKKVLFGAGGLAEGLAPGKIVVDQTTGSPWETREIAAALQARGVQLVDAPVSGGPAGAAAGTIATLCGGPLDAFARVRPILETTGPGVVHFGASGNGHVAKLVKNAIGACNRLITYEAVSLGLRAGLTLEEIEKAIHGSPGRNNTSQRILPVLRNGGETARLRLELMVKDLGLASQLGMSCGAPMMVANEVLGMFQAAVHQLGADANIDEMARGFEGAGAIRSGGR